MPTYDPQLKAEVVAMFHCRELMSRLAYGLGKADKINPPALYHAWERLDDKSRLNVKWFYGLDGNPKVKNPGIASYLGQTNMETIHQRTEAVHELWSAVGPMKAFRGLPRPAMMLLYKHHITTPEKLVRSASPFGQMGWGNKTLMDLDTWLSANHPAIRARLPVLTRLLGKIK